MSQDEARVCTSCRQAVPRKPTQVADLLELVWQPGGQQELAALVCRHLSALASGPALHCLEAVADARHDDAGQA